MSDRALLLGPMEPQFGEDEYWSIQQDLQAQGYHVEYFHDGSSYRTTPDCNLKHVFDDLKNGVAYYYIDTHGHYQCYLAVAYEHTGEGLAQRTSDLAVLAGSEYGFQNITHYELVDEDEYFGIEVWGNGVDYYYTKFNPAASTSTVHMFVCEAFNFAADWGAENVVGYTVTVRDYGEYEAMTLLNRLNGEDNLTRRHLVAAVNDMYLQLYGTGAWCLSPTVDEYSPEAGEYTGNTDPMLVYLRFSTDLVEVDLHEMIYCTDGYILEEEHYPGMGPRWLYPNEIQFYVVPFTCPGSFMPVIRSDVAVSAIGGHELDGGFPYEGDGWGEGPNGDYFGIGYRFADSDPDCDNWATSFVGAGAFVDSTTGLCNVYWQVDFQDGSLYYEVLGAFGEVLATVSAKPVLEYTPVGYLETIDTNEAVFTIVEHDEYGNTTKTRPFVLGERPENLDAIVNVQVPFIDDHRMFPFDDLTLEYGRSEAEVTDMIFVSSRSDFLAAVDPAISILEGEGYSCQTLLTTKDPNDIRNALCPIYTAWDGLGIRPCVVLVGEAYEEYDHYRNVLGKFYLPDSTGMCFFSETCGSDVCLVDFDGDLLPDFDFTRINANAVYEVQNAVEILQVHKDTFHLRDPNVVFMVGDLDNDCDPVDEPRATLFEIATMYMDNGVQAQALYDSAFEDCENYAGRRADMLTIVNNDRPTEEFGSGYLTRRDISPGFFKQSTYYPEWDMSATNENQTFVGWYPGCDFGDGDRLNTSYYPPMCKTFTVTDPDVGTTAVFWTSHGRGAWGRCHLLLAKEVGMWRFSPYVANTVQVSCNAIRRLGHQVGMRKYLSVVHNYGWPVRLDGFVTSVEDETGLSSSVQLSQPFPNPCTTSSLVRFSLPSSMRARVDVFDVNGRVVDTLVDGILDPGWNTLAWEPGSDVGAGMYYCRISAGGTIASKEIMLVK